MISLGYLKCGDFFSHDSMFQCHTTLSMNTLLVNLFKNKGRLPKKSQLVRPEASHPSAIRPCIFVDMSAAAVTLWSR